VSSDNTVKASVEKVAETDLPFRSPAPFGGNTFFIVFEVCFRRRRRLEEFRFFRL
jgi:hypothetical protein